MTFDGFEKKKISVRKHLFCRKDQAPKTAKYFNDFFLISNKYAAVQWNF
jgi:hypothetical protein